MVRAGIFPPVVGKSIAEVTALRQTFVGNVFIAFTTTLPELVVSITAIRRDAVDLAVGDLFGSNLFDLVILAVDDVLYRAAPLLSAIHGNHLVPALSAMAMSAVVVVSLTYRAERKRLLLAWDAIGLLAVAAGNAALLYRLK